MGSRPPKLTRHAHRLLLSVHEDVIEMAAAELWQDPAVVRIETFKRTVRGGGVSVPVTMLVAFRRRKAVIANSNSNLHAGGGSGEAQ